MTGYHERGSLRPSSDQRTNRPSTFHQYDKIQGSSDRESENSAHLRRTNFVFQGSLLAIAGIIVRIIGMIYRVPLTAIIGTEGNGYYTSAFSIYSLLLILSSYSLPTSLSRVISQNLAKNQYKNIVRVLRAALVYATVIGFLMFSVLFFGADRLADMLHKPYVSFSLQALAPTVWIMAYLGIARGYFQGTGNMVPTAISQILEQILNAIVSVLCADILYKKGQIADILYQDHEYACAFGAKGGCIGTGAGALLALIFLLLLYRTRRGHFRRMVRKDPASPDSYRHIALVLGGTMLPILISSTVYNMSTVVDDYIFGNVMTAIGRETEIVLLWGVFGEYRILFNIPVALANSLSSSLIPSLTRAVEAGDRRNTIRRTRYAIRFTMLIAIPATFGMIALIHPICYMLFPSKNVETLISVTRVGAVAILFYSLSTISNAILQGLGYLHVPLRNAVISLVVHIVSLMAMLYAGLDLYAVMWSNILFAFLMCILNQIDIHKHVRFRQGILKTYVYPCIAALIMGAVCYVLDQGIAHVLPASMRDGRLGSAIRLCPAVCVGIVVYFLCLLAMHAFTKEDLDAMPMGGRLKRFVR